MKDYYTHFDADKNYEKTLFLASGTEERPLQSAELNEIEDRHIYHRKMLFDSVFENGDFVSGDVQVEGGMIRISDCLIYADGAIRIIPSTAFKGDKDRVIGLKRIEKTIGYQQDSGLLDPVNPSENFGMPGASRLQIQYIYSDRVFDFEVFRYDHSKKRVFKNSFKKLVRLSQDSEADIVVSDESEINNLHEALAKAAPGNRIYIKSNQFTNRPYQINKDDLSLEIAPGVMIEGSKDLGISRGSPDSDPGKRAIFKCSAQRAVIRGGRIRIQNHDLIGSQYIALALEDASLMLRDIFVFEKIPISGGDGRISATGLFQEK